MKSISCTNSTDTGINLIISDGKKLNKCVPLLSSFQLEDDVVSKPGFFSVMKTYADQQTSEDWILLEFSALGFIGKAVVLSFCGINKDL